MSASPVLLAIRDGSNTLRSFFGTNILTMAWTFATLGAVLGPATTVFAAFVVYRATLSLIRVKQSLPGQKSIVSYGGVVSTVGGHKGQIVVDVLVGLTQFLTCVSYTAFSSENLHNIVPEIPLVVCVIGLDMIIATVSCFHTPFMLAKVSVLTNAMMFTGIGVILTTTDFAMVDSVDYALPLGLPVGVATLSSSLGGITTVLDVERTMTNKPGRYLRFLSMVLPCAVVFLSVVGVVGYLTFGKGTCSVLSLSLKAGSWQQMVAQTVLTIGPGFEGVLNSFPLFVLTEKYTRHIHAVNVFAHTHPYIFKCAHRYFFFIIIALIAHFVPFFGYIAAINGAVGYASLSFLVPVVTEWLRSRVEQFPGDHCVDDPVLGDEEEEEDETGSGERTSLRHDQGGVQNGGYNTASKLLGGTKDVDADGAILPNGSFVSTDAEGHKKFPYVLGTGRKVELALILVFGLFVVIAGTIFAVKDVVEKLSGDIPKSNSTHCSG